jgi:hypothetical protein
VANKERYLLIHVPNILGLDVVLLDNVTEEVEVVMHNGSVQGTGTTFLQPARPLDEVSLVWADRSSSNLNSYLDFEVRATFFKTRWPGYTERRTIYFHCICAYGGQTEGNPALAKTLLGIRMAQ